MDEDFAATGVECLFVFGEERLEMAGFSGRTIKPRPAKARLRPRGERRLATSGANLLLGKRGYQ